LGHHTKKIQKRNNLIVVIIHLKNTNKCKNGAYRESYQIAKLQTITEIDCEKNT